MNAIYSVKEAFAGMRRAKTSTFISISTMTFLLLIIGLFGIIYLNIDHLVDVLNAKVDIQAFVSGTLDDNEIANLGAKLVNIDGVANVQLISKEAAAKEFQKEFGQDVFDVLEENPLPSSFLLTLKKEDQTIVDVKKIAAKIERVPGIDEVNYHGEALNLLNKFSNIASIVNILLLLFVTLGSLFIVSNTIRLIILARKNIIETMKLVGATRGFIRSPFLLEGIFQGTTGGAIAFLFIFISSKLVISHWPGILYLPDYYYFLIIGTGFILGLTGSMIAIKRYL